MTKLLILLLIFSLPFYTISSQSISTLENQLKTTSGLNKVKILNRLSKAYLSKDLQKSIDYGKQAVKSARSTQTPNNIKAEIYNTLGAGYFFSGDYKNSVANYEAELEIIKKTSNSKKIAISYYNIAIIYEKIGKNSNSQKSLEMSLIYAKKARDIALQGNNYRALSTVYEKMGNRAAALESLKAYLRLMDKNFKKTQNILISEIEEGQAIVQELERDTKEKTKQIDSLNYENELMLKIAEQDKELNKSKEIIQKAETAKQKYIKIIMSSIIVFLLFFTFFVVRNIIHKRKTNTILLFKNAEIQQQKEEIKVQNNVLNFQKIELEESNKHITQSITYAKRIQKALIQGEDILEEEFSEQFIFFKPKDIVSGDFYWVKKISNLVAIVAADCTGHGVPGAFMSMLGVSLLNQIVTSTRLDSPGEILNVLRQKVKDSLHQTGEFMGSRDGMDLSFILIDTETLEAKYAGANNAIYLIRDNNLFKYKSTRNPIGIHYQEVDFETQVIKLQKNDSIYLFSDGYVDQFGGEKGRKLKSRKFKEILTKHVHSPMTEQKATLKNILEDWQGENEQVDDILVMGLKI